MGSIPVRVTKTKRTLLASVLFVLVMRSAHDPTLRAKRAELGSHTPLGDLKVYFQGGECGYLRQRRNSRTCEAVARCVPPTPKAVGYPHNLLSRRRVWVSSPKAKFPYLRGGGKVCSADAEGGRIRTTYFQGGECGYLRRRRNSRGSLRFEHPRGVWIGTFSIYNILALGSIQESRAFLFCRIFGVTHFARHLCMFCLLSQNTGFRIFFVTC